VYSGDRMTPYRQWLSAESYEARASIGGSFVSRQIEDYYLTPWDMGYGSFIDFEHDFIGREALQKLAKGPHRKKVTLALDDADVMRAIASQFGKGERAKFMEFPSAVYSMHPFDKVVAGGKTRSASVRRGFEALGAADDDLVAVHDAARPLVSAAETGAVLAAAEACGAAIAAIPVVDTIKEIADGRIVGTLDRSRLAAAATPQAFRAAILRRVLEDGREATDEAGLCEALGISVAVVPVSRYAFKITTPEDLELAEAVLAARAGRSRP